MRPRFRTKLWCVAGVSAVVFAAAGGMAWAGEASDNRALVGATVRAEYVSAPALDDAFGVVWCLPGERAISGGYQAGRAFRLVSSYPVVAEGPADGGPATGWEVVVTNITEKNSQIRVFVVCAGPAGSR